MATKGFAHEDKNNLSVDWYTPWVFERMGLQFDLILRSDRRVSLGFLLFGATIWKIMV